MKAVIYNSFTDRWLVNTITKVILAVLLASNGLRSLLYLIFLISSHAYSTSGKNELYLLSYITRKDFYLGQLASTFLHLLTSFVLFIGVALVFKVPMNLMLVNGIASHIVLFYMNSYTSLINYEKPNNNLIVIMVTIVGFILFFGLTIWLLDLAVYPMEKYVYILGLCTVVWVPAFIYQSFRFFRQDLYQKEVRS